MKNLFLSIIVLTILFVISSCKKEKNDAIADVFARSLIYNGNVSYSTVHSVVSTNVMTSVTVDTPGGESFSLYDHNGLGTAFFKDTSMVGAYPNPEPPATGTYTYHVTFSNGEHQVYTNNLANDFLLPPVIDSLHFTLDGLSLRFKWEPVAGGQSYEMRISSGQNEIFPWNELLDASTGYYQFLRSYFEYYLPGTITWEIRAIKYEDAGRNYVQSIGYSSKSIDF